MSEDHKCFFAFARTATPEQRKNLQRILDQEGMNLSHSVLEGVALLECMAKFWTSFNRLDKDTQDQAIEYAIQRAERRERDV